MYGLDGGIMESAEKQGMGKEGDFSELLARSLSDRRDLHRGERIQAKVVQVGQDWIFLDIGGKFEGILDRNEICDLESHGKVKEGDVLTVYYLGLHGEGHLFTTRISTPEIARSFLEEAFRGRVPVEGVVEKEVKGGLQVRLPGGVRGFCPLSQIEMKRPSEAGCFLGETLSFLIIEYEQGGKSVVVSRRALLEEEMRQRRESLKAQLREGMVVKGKVVSVRDFGAVVDIGGIQGLLPVSEMGWERRNDPHKLVLGQELEVCILRLDWERNRITLSLKEMLPDPWEGATVRYPEGSIHTGMVTRLEPFGAFVALEPGVEGLLHISNMEAGRRVRHPKEILTEGQKLLVKVDSLDVMRRRLSLSLVETGDPELRASLGEQVLEYSTPSSKAPTLGDLMRRKMKVDSMA